MRRSDLQMLARSKIEDAQLLLAHGRYGNAYYLAGYAVELGLKACIARQILAETIPEKRFLNSVYDHGLNKLVVVAQLSDQLDRRKQDDRDFDIYWGIVLKWQPDSRYQDRDQLEAGRLIQAVSDPAKGVLKWIEAYW